MIKCERLETELSPLSAVTRLSSALDTRAHAASALVTVVHVSVLASTSDERGVAPALATALPKANLVPAAGIGSAGRPRSRTSSMYTSARLTARAAEPPLAASPAQSSRRARLCRALTVYVLPLPVWP